MEALAFWLDATDSIIATLTNFPLLSNTAAVLSMKQVIQNEALVDQKNQLIGALKKVSFEVWGSPTEVDVCAIIKKTLAVPPPKCTLQETDEVLHEAEECVRAITLNQKGSRAA